MTNLIWFLLVGLIAGWLAGRVMRGGGFGVIGDIIVGVIGAFLGGLIFGLFTTGDFGFWGSILVAFIGACLLIAIVRAITGRRSIT